VLSVFACNAAENVKNVIHTKNLKVGVLDFQKIVAESGAAKRMNSVIEKKFKPIQTELLDLQSKLEAKATELQRNESVMKESQIEKMRSEVASLRRDLARKGEDFQRDLQVEQAKSSKKFSQLVEAEVDKIGKNGGFDMILQKQATVYIKNEFDVTDKLIEALK